MTSARDELTGLMDRADLDRHVRQNWLSRTLALVVLDLDGLKAVNQALGYAAGDRLLVTAAARLSLLARERSDLLARINGDQFAVLISSHDRQNAMQVAQRLAAVLSAPYSWQGGEQRIGVSVGVAVHPGHSGKPDDLLAQGQAALRAAQNAGGACVRMFEPHMEIQRSPWPTTADFASACDRDEWQLLYQPQVNLMDGSLTGVEALLRWNDPERGQLAPGHFLHQLEADANAPEVARWVLDRACRDLAGWRRSGIAVPRVSVNLFAAQLEGRRLFSDVRASLSAHELTPDDLELELTEHVALDVEPGWLEGLNALHAEGVHIALDDFGTGYACLSSLRRLPLSCLKIDRSFIAGLGFGLEDLAVVRALLSIGADLRLRVIAEGVETQAQAHLLRTLGCSYAQGYLYAHPVQVGMIGHTARFF